MNKLNTEDPLDLAPPISSSRRWRRHALQFLLALFAATAGVIMVPLFVCMSGANATVVTHSNYRNSLGQRWRVRREESLMATVLFNEIAWRYPQFAISELTCELPNWSRLEDRNSIDDLAGNIGPPTAEIAYGWPLRFARASARRMITKQRYQDFLDTKPSIVHRDAVVIIDGIATRAVDKLDPFNGVIPTEIMLPAFLKDIACLFVPLYLFPILIRVGVRRRRRLRAACERCGYDVSNIPDVCKCPECGMQVNRNETCDARWEVVLTPSSVHVE